MTDYYIQSLLTSDGTWDAFCEDWRIQCGEAGEDFADFAPDTIDLLAGIAASSAPPTKLSMTGVSGVRAGENGRFHAVCMLNRALLPGTNGRTLRVRHLLMCPRLDFGLAEAHTYADTLIGTVSGIVHLSSTFFEAEHLSFHLRSPEDMAFFRALGSILGRSPMFTSVQSRGSWLYITKSLYEVEHEVRDESSVGIQDDEDHR